MKKLTNKNLFLVLVLTLIFTGCAQWQNASGVQKINSQKITLDLKDEKWHSFNNKEQETYILTKDGVYLQSLLIKRVPLDMALKSSKKIIPENILLHELAELIIEDLKLANGMNSFQVLSNRPEKVDIKDAVEIISQVKDPNDNQIKINSTYFIYDKKLYQISYSAPNQYFYNRDLNTYLSIKKSIKLNL